MRTAIRLPNWLGDVVMALPVVRAIVAQFPQTTLFGNAVFETLLQALGLSYTYQALPARGWRYYPHFLQYRGAFDQAILFANSERCDIEMWLTGTPVRYGIAWSGRARMLVNHRYRIKHPNKDDRHQTQLWADFTAYNSLQAGISTAPLNGQRKNCASRREIVLIAGSENNPEKRWPIANWRALTAHLIESTDMTIVLTGTHRDKPINQAIRQGFPSQRVKDLAGKTQLSTFVQQLARTHLVVGNDTGGLHLANALGVPVIGLYGPTNPQRTRPIFDAPLSIVQPPNLSLIGSGKMVDITIDSVVLAVDTALMDDNNQAKEIE